MVRIKIAVIPHMLLLHLNHFSCTHPATAPLHLIEAITN